MVRRLSITLVLAVLAGSTASAHPAPFSFVDVRIEGTAVSVRLVAHAFDLAHELGLSAPDSLMDPGVADRYREALARVLAERLAVEMGERRTTLAVTGLEVLPERQSVAFAYRGEAPPDARRLDIDALLFPYDPVHQTFVNIYEEDRLVRQAILDATHTRLRHDLSSRQDVWSVFVRFLGQGIHHILIGPDHILFLIGLLLMGGSLRRLVAIVTAFTLAHSLTLSLAVLDLVSPPAELVEPVIALSIVYVGADNLLMTQDSRDVRPWIAFAFGLVHGFGFASVLREIGLPPAALGASLFSFNVGVEIGQLVIVALCASVLTAVRQRNAGLARRIAVAGSTAVIMAGGYWFVERILGGGTL